MSKSLHDSIQELLWQAAELQARSFKERLEVDLNDEVPTDAATLNALTAALKLHGVHLGAAEEAKDPVDQQKAALARLAELRDKLKSRPTSTVMGEDEIERILQ